MSNLSLRHYWYALGGVLVLEVVSWVTFRWLNGSSIVLIALIVLGLVLVWRRPTWLAYAAVAEVVVGGKGYLLSATLGGFTLSLRMVLFVLVVLTALIHYLRQRQALLVLSRPFVYFIGWVAVSAVFGIVYRHGLTAVYSDANAFLFLAELPVWWMLLRRDPDWRRRVLAILLAGVTLMALKTWIVMVLFAKSYSGLRNVYVWIRETGIGEVTYIQNNAYRVFFQGHIMAVMTLVLLVVLYVQRQWQRWYWWPLLAAGTSVYLSLSRSFWLSLVIVLMFMVGYLILRRRFRQLIRLWILLPVAVVAWGMMTWGLSFPGFSLHSSAIAGNRFTASDAVNSATARQNQIRPLLSAISHHPILGSGFGQTVTYYSTDPSYQGWRTTAAFELGYLDLWLKLGLLGLGLYAWWLWSIWRRGWMQSKHWGLVVGGLALAIIHLTTPYLNHPLGLSWLMLTSIFVYAE